MHTYVHIFSNEVYDTNYGDDIWYYSLWYNITDIVISGNVSTQAFKA